jgi:Tfp pilus assembly protein PilE
LVNNIIKEEKSPPKKELGHLGYIGTQGKRGKLFVKLVDRIEKPDDDYIIFKVVDPKGNRGYFYNYKTKEGGIPSLAVNDCFLMDATPARHEMSRYDSCKVTYFNRIVVLENKGNNESAKIG